MMAHAHACTRPSDHARARSHTHTHTHSDHFRQGRFWITIQKAWFLTSSLPIQTIQKRDHATGSFSAALLLSCSQQKSPRAIDHLFGPRNDNQTSSTFLQHARAFLVESNNKFAETSIDWWMVSQNLVVMHDVLLVNKTSNAWLFKNRWVVPPDSEKLENMSGRLEWHFCKMLMNCWVVLHVRFLRL